jgi:NADPH:quinone reductase-like Zn-dependent oxidoreductase
VGLFLLQLASARGIDVIAVGRRAMHEQMLRLGAIGCIDYSAEDIAIRAADLAQGPVDAVADLVGGAGLGGVLGAVRSGGQLASIATPELDLDPLLDANLTFHGVLIGDDGSRTRRLAELLADGTLSPVVSHVLPLAEAAQAHWLQEQGHPGGKIVLDLGR